MKQTDSYIEKMLPYIILLGGLYILSSYYYYESIHFFPSHIHAWTQSDRFAIALQFLNNNFNLFKPQTFNLFTTDGITGVDFAIHEWVVAVIMKLFDITSPIVFRMYTLCMSFLGYFFLFRLTKEITKSFWKGMVVVLFVFTCPIITYYQAGFIPSSTSFASAIIAYHYYFRFKQNGLLSYFYIGIGLMTLAALVRTPFNIFLFAILIQQVWSYLINKKLEWKEIVVFVMAYGCIIAYTWYKAYLNKVYGSQFLTFLLPPENIEDLYQILLSVKERWTLQMFTINHYFLLIVVGILVVYYKYKGRRWTFLDHQILVQSILILAGSGVYFLLMAKQYVDHEYYFMDSFYLGIIFLFIIGIEHIGYERKKNQIFWMVFFFAVLSGAIIQSKEIQELKYSETLWDRGEVTRKNFVGSDEFLDSLSISREAKILVIDAYSTNAPFILMDRKGYPILSTRKESLIRALELDYDYIVVQDIFLPSDVVSNYPEILNRIERIGGNGRISVFKLSPENAVYVIGQALGINDPFKIVRMDFDSFEQSQEWINVYPVKEQPSRSKPYSFLLDEASEYGPTFQIKVKPKDFSKVLFEAYFVADKDIQNIRCVATITNSEEQYYYWDFTLRLKATKDDWQKYQCLFTIPDRNLDNANFKWFLWNPEKERVYIDDIKMTFY